MKADVFSGNPYFPMYMSNGEDTVLVDYTGMANGYGGHSHCEQTQGAVCGWYKGSNRHRENDHALQPNFAFQLAVKMFGALAEPSCFSQEFLPETATLITELTYAKTVKMRVTAFLDSHSLLFQKAEVLENPMGYAVDLGWQIAKPVCPMAGVTFRAPLAFAGKDVDKRLHRFTYENGIDRGQGFMLCDWDYDGTAGDIGWFYEVPVGFTAVRAISCADTGERFDIEAVLEERLGIAKAGWESAYAAHKAEWGAYFASNDITVDDEELTYLYRVSRYILRANQHPTGRIALGNIPSLWGGGIYDTFDEWVALMALLRAGNRQEGRALINAYAEQAHFGRDALKEKGMHGVAFAGWDDCYGGYLSWRPYFDYITHYKPLMSMIFVVMAYWQYFYDKASLTPEIKAVVQEVVDFLVDYIIIENPDGSFCLKEVNAGTEAAFSVKVDSFNQMFACRSMDFAAEMLGDPRYAEIGASLRQGLNVNFTEDGVLMPFDGAFYTGAIHILLYSAALPEKLGYHGLDVTYACGKTPFGFSGDQTTEEYRHWPWFDSMAVSAYAYEGQGKKADPYFTHMKEYASSLGAIPEKIRLDNAVVGYWYTTSHAYFVTAMNDAMALLDGDTVRVGYGFDTAVKTAAAKGVCLNHVLSADLRVEDSRVCEVVLRNAGETPLTVTADIAHRKPMTVTLRPGENKIL